MDFYGISSIFRLKSPSSRVQDHYDLQNLSVLELGCGLPFLAAALSGLGAQVDEYHQKLGFD